MDNFATFLDFSFFPFLHPPCCFRSNSEFKREMSRHWKYLEGDGNETFGLRGYPSISHWFLLICLGTKLLLFLNFLPFSSFSSFYFFFLLRFLVRDVQTLTILGKHVPTPPSPNFNCLWHSIIQTYHLSSTLIFPIMSPVSINTS